MSETYIHTTSSAGPYIWSRVVSCHFIDIQALHLHRIPAVLWDTVVAAEGSESIDEQVVTHFT